MSDVVARVSSTKDSMPLKPRSITGLFIRQRMLQCFYAPVAENPVVEASLNDGPALGEDEHSLVGEAALGGASALWVCKPSVGTWYTKTIRLQSAEPLVSSCGAPALEDAQQKPVGDAPADKVSVSKPAGRWATELSHKIGSSLGIFKDKEMMLDTDTYKSVSHAVSELDAGRVLCEAGICIVYSVSKESYFLLFRSDAEQAAYERYGLKAAASTILDAATATAAAPDPAPAMEAVGVATAAHAEGAAAGALWAWKPSVGTWLAKPARVKRVEN